jgi:hypothetical protein
MTAIRGTLNMLSSGSMVPVYLTTDTSLISDFDTSVRAIVYDVLAGMQITKTAAQWTTDNTVLRATQIGIESDTRFWKLGDGTTAWNSLPYMKHAFNVATDNVIINIAGEESFADNMVVFEEEEEEENTEETTNETTDGENEPSTPVE